MLTSSSEPRQLFSISIWLDDLLVNQFNRFACVDNNGFYYSNGNIRLNGCDIARHVHFDFIGDLTSSEISNVFSTIENTDLVGELASGPLLVGALPFERSTQVDLFIPELVIVTSRDKGTWATLTLEHPVNESLAREYLAKKLNLLSSPSGFDLSPDYFVLRSEPTKDEWLEIVKLSQAKMAERHLEKVVLSRRVHVSSSNSFTKSAILERLSHLYPTCTTFCFGDFLGASPELLVSKIDTEIRSVPLAGTVARSGNSATDLHEIDQMLESQKQRLEHNITSTWVAARLAEYCDSVNLPKVPSVVSLRNVSHLSSSISANYSGEKKYLSALELARILHPTPALAGFPIIESMDLISELEGIPRGNYGAPVGWVDSRGNGDYVVGIRSATVTGRNATLYSGVGILPDSDPRQELIETQLKLQALLSAIVRP